MIGKGKSIAHTKASMAYGWNQEKDAEIILKEFLHGDSPAEITKEFKMLQDQNYHCTKNTLSFVISPTIEDGKKLNKKELQTITKCFMHEMKLGERQAIAFIHQDKNHKHIHLYVNRIDFKGAAYNDSFIGKRSQLAAEKASGLAASSSQWTYHRQRCVPGAGKTYECSSSTGCAGNPFAPSETGPAQRCRRNQKPACTALRSDAAGS